MRELGYDTMTSASTWEFGLVSRETRIGARSVRHAAREVQASCTMLVTLTSYNPETGSVSYGNRGVRTTHNRTSIESFVTLELITNDGTAIVQKYGDGTASAESSQLTSFSLNLPDIKHGEKKDEKGRIVRRAKRIDLGQIRTTKRNDTRGRAARGAAVEALVKAFGNFQ